MYSGLSSFCLVSVLYFSSYRIFAYVRASPPLPTLQTPASSPRPGTRRGSFAEKHYYYTRDSQLYYLQAHLGHG